MNEPNDQRLDELIRGHIASQLDPHLGKAAKTFAAVSLPTMRSRRFWLRAAGSIVALAASLAVAWVAVTINQDGRPPAIKMTAKNSGPETTASLIELERTVTWQTFDEGTVVLEDNTPVRQIRRQSVQQIQWYDPNEKAIIETTSPHEEVFFINLNRS